MASVAGGPAEPGSFGDPVGSARTTRQPHGLGQYLGSTNRWGPPSRLQGVMANQGTSKPWRSSWSRCFRLGGVEASRQLSILTAHLKTITLPRMIFRPGVRIPCSVFAWMADCSESNGRLAAHASARECSRLGEHPCCTVTGVRLCQGPLRSCKEAAAGP